MGFGAINKELQWLTMSYFGWYYLCSILVLPPNSLLVLMFLHRKSNEELKWKPACRVCDATGIVMLVKIHFRKLRAFFLLALKRAQVMKSWHCYRQQPLTWRNLRGKQLVFLLKMVSGMGGGLFPPEMIICWERWWMSTAPDQPLYLLSLSPLLWLLQVLLMGRHFTLRWTVKFL